ncbi:MAG: inositol monophosphatase [Acidiferrobacteraceae bacterium]|jgi:myo-inositol-1(or 4)-monophosphatase|nr:inositol monophosphatase [Acidiferrobacteraceae bacterium]|tara:strand:- start:20966 stop:21742 length:777 start_codon:yes stop_codon:yes gene_type:complete
MSKNFSLEKEQYSYDFKLALQAAKQAGDFLFESYAKNNSIEKMMERDVKIEEDIQSEEIILNVLKNTDYSILSEEKGEIASQADSELKWIVDPLDGTYNYLRRIPFCAVSIALWKGDEPIFGIVNSFCLNEIFSGIIGVGAWCNEIPICHVENSHRNNLENSIIASGFPVGFVFSDDSVSRLLEITNAYKKVRMLGSASISLAYVASNRVDAYREENIMLWDVAGGLAIVKSAGGDYSSQKTDIVNQFTVSAVSSKRI